MTWKQIVQIIANAVLASNPKTAPIANEVSEAIVEAEAMAVKGAEKKSHVIAIAKKAAQAADEILGTPDDVAGHVSVATDHIITAANEITEEVKHLRR